MALKNAIIHSFKSENDNNQTKWFIEDDAIPLAPSHHLFCEFEFWLDQVACEQFLMRFRPHCYRPNRNKQREGHLITPDTHYEYTSVIDECSSIRKSGNHCYRL